MAPIVSAITRLVMAIIELCRLIKVKDEDETESAILGIIEKTITGIFG